MVNDGGYDAAVKDDILRDILVICLGSGRSIWMI